MASAADISHSGFDKLLEFLSKEETEKEFVSKLHEAAFKGDKVLLRTCLSKPGADVNESDEDGKTALHVALGANNNDLVELLLKHGLSANAKTVEGDIPLHLCCDIDAAKLLIANGSLVDVKNDGGITPLLRCVYSGLISLVEYLLKIGADVNAQNNNGETALHYLGLVGRASNHYDIVKLLLDYDININIKDKTSKTAIHNACQSANVGIARLLIKNGAKINEMDFAGNYPLHYCFTQDRKEVLELLDLLLQNAETANLADIRGVTALHNASASLSKSVVEFIVHHGANVNQADNMGKTPLHYATKNKDDGVSVTEFLIKNGGNVNKCDRWGQTPLHDTAENENLESMKVLLADEVDIHRRDATGLTPLHVASTKRDSALVKHLIDNKADVNVVDKNSATPLHFAAWAGAGKTALELLKSGANKSIKDNAGQTPLDVAYFRRSNDVVTVFTKETGFQSNVQMFSNIANELMTFETISNMLQTNKPIKRAEDDLHTYLLTILSNTSIGRGADDEEAEEIQNCVEGIIQALAQAISSLDQMLKCVVLHAGSTSEGTKTKDPDEFDFMFCLENLSKGIKIRFIEEDIVSSAALKVPPVPGAETSTIDERTKGENMHETNTSVSDYVAISLRPAMEASIFSGVTVSKQIPCYKMFSFFSELVNKIVFGKNFPTQPKLLPVEVTLDPALKLRWRGCRYKDLIIDVDLVPAVSLPSWSDKYQKGLALLTTDILRITSVAVPKTTAGANEDLWRCSLALVESAIFRKFRPEIRNSYIVCKAMFSSAILPHISFEDYAEYKYAYKMEHSSVTSEELQDINFHESSEKMLPSYVLKMTFLSVVEDLAKKNGITFVYEANKELAETAKSKIFTRNVSESVPLRLKSGNNEILDMGGLEACSAGHMADTTVDAPGNEQGDNYPSDIKHEIPFYGPALNMFKGERSLEFNVEIVKEVFKRCLDSMSKEYVPSFFNPRHNVLGERILSEDAYKCEAFLKIINAIIEDDGS